VVQKNKAGRNKRIVAALKPGEQGSGREPGQTSPRLLPDPGFGLDNPEPLKGRRGS